ncbi:MAG: hypothetical protein CVU90_11855 [Firmicutes bacterium HGW-Firmicutes-15]|nr:MAG: hypothetical protein CVU90_11855 [Firmicutes bacterium HGW-Firmicutes-15]
MLYSKYGIIFFKYGLPSFFIVLAIGVRLFHYLCKKAAKNEKANALMGKIPLKPEYLKGTIKVLAYISILSFAYVSSFGSGTAKADLNIANIAPLIEANIDRNFTDLEILGESLKIDSEHWRVYKPDKYARYARYEEEATITGPNNFGSVTFTLCRDRDAARKLYDSKLESVVSQNILQESGNIGENRYYLTLIHGVGRTTVLGPAALAFITEILEGPPESYNLSILKNNLIIDLHPYYHPEPNLCTLLDTPYFQIMNPARVPNPYADALILETAAVLYAIPTE